MSCARGVVAGSVASSWPRPAFRRSSSSIDERPRVQRFQHALRGRPCTATSAARSLPISAASSSKWITRALGAKVESLPVARSSKRAPQTIRRSLARAPPRWTARLAVHAQHAEVLRVVGGQGAQTLQRRHRRNARAIREAPQRLHRIGDHRRPRPHTAAAPWRLGGWRARPSASDGSDRSRDTAARAARRIGAGGNVDGGLRHVLGQVDQHGAGATFARDALKASETTSPGCRRRRAPARCASPPAG